MYRVWPNHEGLECLLTHVILTSPSSLTLVPATLRAVEGATVRALRHAGCASFPFFSFFFSRCTDKKSFLEVLKSDRNTGRMLGFQKHQSSPQRSGSSAPFASNIEIRLPHRSDYAVYKSVKIVTPPFIRLVPS